MCCASMLLLQAMHAAPLMLCVLHPHLCVLCVPCSCARTRCATPCHPNTPAQHCMVTSAKACVIAPSNNSGD